MSVDEYTRIRTERFVNELDNMTSNMENLEYFGSAEGVVFASVNGRRELLSVEISPSELYPENAERLQTLIVEAIKDANCEVDVAEQYIIGFISEDLALGC